MALKHILATAAITGALVAAGTISAQATPLPVPPGPVNLPIYTVPSMPGFHLPVQIKQTKPGPQLKLGLPDTFRPYSTLPTSCSQLISLPVPQLGNLLPDTSVRATTDGTLITQLNAHHSLNCNWSNTSSGLQVEVSVARISTSDGDRLNGLFTYLGYASGTAFPNETEWQHRISDQVVEYDYVSAHNYWLVVRENDEGGDLFTDSINNSIDLLNGFGY